MTKRNPFAKDLPEMAQGLREGGSEAMDGGSGTELQPGSSYARSDPARLNTYLDAISTLSPNVDDRHWVKFSTRRAIVEAVMALADAEHSALTAEVEWLRGLLDADGSRIDQLTAQCWDLANSLPVVIRCQGCDDAHCNAATS